MRNAWTKIRAWFERFRGWVIGALAFVSIAGTVFMGGGPIEPPAVMVNGTLITYPFTDDNTGEQLLIYTDKETYVELGEATVNFAVVNTSAEDQGVNLMFYFGDKSKGLSMIEVLQKDAVYSYEADVFGKKCEAFDDFNTSTGKKVSSTTCFQAKTGTKTATATKDVWNPTPTLGFNQFTDRDKKVTDAGLSLKSIGGYTAKKKNIVFIKAGDTAYFRARVYFPNRTHDKFYIEAVGQSGYGALDPWMDSNWLYRKQISVDRTRISSALTNFPIRVSLTGSNFDFSKATSTGIDVRFTDSGGTTTLSFDREYHSSTTASGEYWVLLPTVSSTATTTFYIYYGNSNASDGEAQTATWVGYDFVSHAYDGVATTTFLDATFYNATSTKRTSTGPTEASGTIYKGEDFERDSVAANNGDFAYSLGDSMGGNASMTVSFLLKQESTGNAVANLIGSGADQSGAFSAYNWVIFQNGTPVVRFTIQKAVGNVCDVSGATTLSTTTGFAYMAGTLSATQCSVYLNSFLDATTTISGSMNDSGGRLHFGGARTNSDTSYRNFADGIIDEVRMSSTSYSTAYLNADYYSNFDLLNVFGSEETDTPAVGGRRRPIMLVE